MLKNILKSEFSRNVMTLLTGSAIAQFIPLLLTPVLSRLFSPEEFGLFAFYYTLVSFFLVIATGRYELAILLPKKDKEAINVMGLAILLSGILSIFLLLALFIFKIPIQNLLGKPDLNQWLYLIPVCVFLGSGYKVLTYWSNRKKRFKGTSISVVTQATLRSSTVFYFGLLKSGFFGLSVATITFFKEIFHKSYAVPVGVTELGIAGFILGYVIGFGSAFLTLIFAFIKNDRELLSQISRKQMKAMGIRYKKFPQINMFHAMTDEFKNSGVTLIISYVFSDIVLGLYSMTYRVLRAPLSVIGNSFSQVFLQKAAEMYANKQNYLPIIHKVTKKLATISLPFFILVMLFGPQIFEFILGDKWSTAGEYARYLSPWLFVQFVTAPITQIAVIIEKQKELFLVSLINNAIIIGSLVVGGFVFNNILIGFAVLSILQIIYSIYLYKWILRVSKKAIEENQL